MQYFEHVKVASHTVQNNVHKFDARVSTIS